MTTWRSPSRGREEAGVATVWAIAWIAVVMSLAWIGMLAAAVAARQHKVDGAADLVALSAAARLQRGGSACDEAAALAERNDVSLHTCAVDGTDVVVVVTDVVALPLGLDGRLESRSRAGP